MADFDEYEYLERQLEGGKPDEKPGSPKSGAGEDAGPAEEQPNGGDRERRERSPDRKSKDRRRSRSRDKRRSSRSRSRDRRRDKDDRRERDDRDRRDKRDERRDRDRDRRDDRDYDRRDDRRGRDYDRGRRNDRDNERRRERTPPEVRAAREAEKELREMERSTRTAFAYNLNLKADERDIYQLFAKVGKVVDIKLITDKTTKRSKGFAYIEFSKVEEVLAAVALTGTVFMGQAIMVKSSEHEKNLAWEAQQQAKASQAKAAAGAVAAGVLAPGPCRLYIGNLNAAIAEADVQQLFSPFGTIDLVQVQRDASGKSQGFGYVTFSNSADAVKALEHWNDRVVAGAALKVTVAAPAAGAAAALLPGLAGAIPGLAGAVPGLLPPPPGIPLTLTPELASQFGLALPGAVQGALPGALPGPPPMPGLPDPVVNSGIGELDEEESRGGLKLTSDRRQALMARLATSAGMAPPPIATLPGMGAPPAAAAAVPAGLRLDPALGLIQSVLGPASPIPTPCLLIKNMFEPQAAEAESGPGWAEEIAADVQDECAKYGAIVHVHVDKDSKGCVYLKFGSTESAAAAQQALNGRWFGGRQLGVDFQFLQPYNSHFKC